MIKQTIPEALAAFKYSQDGKEYTYFKEGSMEDLKGEKLPEGSVEIGGKSYTLAEIDMWSAFLFATELDSKLGRLNPHIYDVYAKYAVNCFDLVRMVNVQTKQGFRGASGSGNELDAMPFLSRSLYDPDNSTNKRTTWVRTIGSTGAKWFFEGATATSELTTAEEEGMIWLAFYNPASTPCIDAFQITMNTIPFNVQGLDFDQVNLEEGESLIELKEPWTLPPEQAGKIQAYYFQTGTDETTPIGLWVKESRNVRALATP